MINLSRPCFRFSKYVETLYQKSKLTQTSFFTLNSNSCRIVEDPLDFYALLTNSISNSSHRIGLSCLYLSTGPLQRHLLNKVAQRHKMCPDMTSALVFDHHRSSREESGESPMEMINNWAEQVGSQTSVAFPKVSSGRGVISEVRGVHHQKIYVFDDRVVLTGANLQRNYFLNRRDRIMLIDSPQLSDYLFEYLQLLANNPKQTDLLTHYRLWKYGHMPSQYCQTFQQQVNYLKTIQSQKQSEVGRSFTWQKPQKNLTVSRNVQIAKQLGTSITAHSPMPLKQFEKRRQTVRDRLFGVKSQDYVGNQIEEIEEGHWNTPIKAGKDIHIFPFMQCSPLNQKLEYSLFEDVLRLAAQQNHHIKLTSGYLNLQQSLFQQISKLSELQTPIQLLCSSPEANSFYRAKGLKGMVPYMYRSYELALLKKLGDKVDIRQFFDGKWSYHAKGIWIEQADNSLLTVIGSSNFNERSKHRDSQFQFYIYSGCEQFNQRLREEWKNLQKDCKKVSVNQIQSDDDIKLKWYHRYLAEAVSSIL